MDFKKLFGRKEKKIDVNGLREKMDELMAHVARTTMSDEVIETAREAIASRFKEAGVEYNALNLKIMKMGMGLMLGADSRDIQIPLLLVQSRLIEVETNLEKVTK